MSDETTPETCGNCGHATPHERPDAFWCETKGCGCSAGKRDAFARGHASGDAEGYARGVAEERERISAWEREWADVRLSMVRSLMAAGVKEPRWPGDLTQYVYRAAEVLTERDRSIATLTEQLTARIEERDAARQERVDCFNSLSDQLAALQRDNEAQVAILRDMRVLYDNGNVLFDPDAEESFGRDLCDRIDAALSAGVKP